jgi:riboflavin synthase
MFTGMVSDIGQVLAVELRGDTRVTIACGYDPSEIGIGASILCAGICLSAVAKGTLDGRNYFVVEASAETMARTTLGSWRAGASVNLERALKVGDELGGHLVSGHVDGVGEVVEVTAEGGSMCMRVRAPLELVPFIAPKGSICLDGASLTVNEIDACEFRVNLIPHTLAATTFGAAAAGQTVNVEIDMLARYVARLANFRIS